MSPATGAAPGHATGATPATGAATFRVVRGHPTRREAAALAVALAQLGGPDSGTQPPPAWLRAAHTEGCGGRPVASPADLRAVDGTGSRPPTGR